MPAAINQSAKGFNVRLDGDIGIEAMLELKRVLIEALAGPELKLEFAGVTVVDVTTLQLIWATEQAAAKAGVKLLLSDPIPPEMQLAMDLAGLERFAVTPR